MTKIPIADDEEFAVVWLRDKLISLGHDIDIASTEKEILDMLKNQGPYDLIILDIMIRIAPYSDIRKMKKEETLKDSRRSGIRILKYIREEMQMSQKKFPVICYSVVNEGVVIDRIREMKAVYIPKGDRTEDIISTVKKILENKH